ncbi:MAG TPA: hypothetical protein VE958_03750 [Bryobacteraceae bacterium]|nr:hypothetical protein [Bryobacteraceae bacterium]
MKLLRTIPLLFLIATSLSAQDLRVGVIDFYGLRKISESQIRKVLGVREGDPLPASKGDAEAKLDQISGVVESHLEAVCCDADRTILYVGIEERGATHFDLREPPEGSVVLPEEIVSAYSRFLDAAHDASRRGSTDEDLTHGHPLMADGSARAVQDMFPALADAHLAEIREVLRNSEDEAQRAMAAYVLVYATRKSGIVNDLQYALKDADAGVRNNAARSLVALSVLAKLDPSSEVRISATWFIEMLNSLSWSDRNRALWALQTLTDSRDPVVLDQLRTRAMDALIDMARWKTLSHALPAFILLGRVAGMPEPEIQAAWTRGDRDSVISAAKKKSR